MKSQEESSRDCMVRRYGMVHVWIPFSTWPSPQNSRRSTEHGSVISPVPATTREIRGSAMTKYLSGWKGCKGGDRSGVWQLTCCEFCRAGSCRNLHLVTTPGAQFSREYIRACDLGTVSSFQRLHSSCMTLEIFRSSSASPECCATELSSAT